MSTSLPSKTASEKFRAKGNLHYEKFCISTNLQDRKVNLEKSIIQYSLAYDSSDNPTEQSSAAKNLGTAASKLAEILHETNVTLPLVVFRYKESVTYLSKALLFGRRSNRSVEWLDSLVILYIDCVSITLNILEAFPLTQRLQGIEQLIQAMSEDSQKAECYWSIAQDLFAAGVVALGEKNHRKALQHFHDCHRPVEEGRRMAVMENIDYIVREMEIKRNELNYSLATAEALQAISAGMT